MSEQERQETNRQLSEYERLAEKKRQGVRKQLEEAAATGIAYRGNIKVQMNNQEPVQNKIKQETVEDENSDIGSDFGV